MMQKVGDLFLEKIAPVVEVLNNLDRDLTVSDTTAIIQSVAGELQLILTEQAKETPDHVFATGAEEIVDYLNNAVQQITTGLQELFGPDAEIQIIVNGEQLNR